MARVISQKPLNYNLKMLAPQCAPGLFYKYSMAQNPNYYMHMIRGLEICYRISIHYSCKCKFHGHDVDYFTCQPVLHYGGGDPLGFRKIVPERWEFANEFFRKGERHLLCEIHRRKSVQHSPPNVVAEPHRPISPSNSADEQTWSSASSPTSSPGFESASRKTAMEENEKLKRENLSLASELAQMKKLCNHLLIFLSKHVNITADHVTSFLSQTVDPLERVSMLARLKDYLEQYGDCGVKKEETKEDLSANDVCPVQVQVQVQASSAEQSVAAPKGLPFLDGMRRVGRNPGGCVKIEEEDDKNGNSPKLFGVPLISKKRPHPETAQPESLMCKVGRCKN